VEHGDRDAVKELVTVLCASGDERACTTAHSALISLSDPGAIDTFCYEVMIRHDVRLLDIVSACRYVPSEDAERALFFFDTDNWDALARLDALPGNPLLLTGYMNAGPDLQTAVLSHAKDPVRANLFAHVLIGDETGNGMNGWSIAEWERVMDGLVSAAEWDECWRILFSAPLPVAVFALHRIRASGWIPPGDDRTLWETLTGTLPDAWTYPAPEPLLHQTLERPVSHATCLVFSPDASLLATAGSDGMIRVWRVAGGTLLHAWQAGMRAARALAFIPDGGGLACIGSDGVLQCRDPLTGALLWDTAIGTDGATCMAVVPGSGAIICGTADGSLHVRDCRDGYILVSEMVYRSAVSHLSLSPDGRKIVSAAADGTLSVHTFDGTTIRHAWSMTHQGVRHLAFAGGSDRFVVVGDSPEPVIRDATSGHIILPLTGNEGDFSGTVSVYDTGIAIGRTDHIFSVWQFLSGAHIAVPVYHQGIASAAATRTGTLLVAGCTNGMIRLFRLPGGMPERTFKAHTGLVTACTVSPDGSALASCGWDGTVKLWSLPAGELIRTLRGRADEVTCMCGMPNGASVITGNTDGTGRVLCTEGECLARTLDLFTSTVRALAVNADGTHLACAGGDTTVRIWRIANGGLLGTCSGLTSTTRCLAFTPDGKTLVTGGWDGKVRFWQVPGTTLITESTGHSGVVTFCTASPTGSFVVTVANDASVILWDPATGNRLHSFGCGWHHISACALSPDGRTLALGRKDGSLCTVSLPSGSGRTDLPKIPETVTSLAFTGDSGTLIAGYETGCIAVFSCEESRLIRSMSTDTGAIRGIVHLPCKDRFVSTGSDGVCRVWNLPFTRQLKDTCPDDIARIAEFVHQTPAGPVRAQWRFLLHFLQGRFRHEVGICVSQPVASAYDIQIVG
jgi:WD40 repeat protein